MRYTEKKQDLDVTTDGSFLRTFFLKILRSPYTIISEMGMKIPFLEKRMLERILTVAILIASMVVAATCLIRFSTNSFSLTAGAMPLIFMIGGLLVLIVLYFILISFKMKVYNQMSQLAPAYAEESKVKDDLSDLCETEAEKDEVHNEVEQVEDEEVPEEVHLEPELPEEVDTFDDVAFDELDLESLDSPEVTDMNDYLQDLDADGNDLLKEPFSIDELAEKPAKSLDGFSAVADYQNRNQTFIENFIGTTIDEMPQDVQQELLKEIERNEGIMGEHLEDLARSESVQDDFDGDDLNTWDVPEYFRLTA